MSKPEYDAVLDGWERGEFSAAGITHPTYRRGSGPGVIVIHEVPNITPLVTKFANEVVDRGFEILAEWASAVAFDPEEVDEALARYGWRTVEHLGYDQLHERYVAPTGRELGWMAFVMLFIFWIWMYQARTLFAVFFGFEGFATMEGFLRAVFTTWNGWLFLLAGHVVGAIISMVLFTLTVVSCPLLLDRDADFVTAMITSTTRMKRPIPT